MLIGLILISLKVLVLIQCTMKSLFLTEPLNLKTSEFYNFLLLYSNFFHLRKSCLHVTAPENALSSFKDCQMTSKIRELCALQSVNLEVGAISVHQYVHGCHTIEKYLRDATELQKTILPFTMKGRTIATEPRGG